MLLKDMNDSKSTHKRDVLGNDMAKFYHFINPWNAEACHGIATTS